MAKSMRLQLEVEMHAVTCPGVWFPCKSPVYLSICFLGFHVRTKPFPASFPLLFCDKFIFEKTFPGVSTLQQLTLTLEHQTLYIELLQEIEPGAPSGNQRVLATFETSGLEFLFPHPQLRPSYTSGVDVDLLMEPTRDFPGVIAPKIEASTRTHMAETRNPHLEQLHDNAVTMDQAPPMSKHPHLGPGPLPPPHLTSPPPPIPPLHVAGSPVGHHHNHQPYPKARGRSHSFSRRNKGGRNRSKDSSSSLQGSQTPHLHTPPPGIPPPPPTAPKSLQIGRGCVHRSYMPHPDPTSPMAPLLPNHHCHPEVHHAPPGAHRGPEPPPRPLPPPPPPPPNFHDHDDPLQGPLGQRPHRPHHHHHHHHHEPPHEHFPHEHGAHCHCNRDHLHPPFDIGFYHHPTCPSSCSANHCHPYPLCLDPVGCPHQCHVDTHPHYPSPPSSTPHIHSRNVPHRPHYPSCYEGMCCHS